ncbi:MAG: DegQ family serine endoprotease [Nitrospirae bacterium]|nr:MAG: DegQ family serine endoprotease [Nitrospirota bacterium]
MMPFRTVLQQLRSRRVLTVLIVLAVVGLGWGIQSGGLSVDNQPQLATASPPKVVPVSTKGSIRDVDAFNRRLIETAKRAMPSVVNISVLSTAETPQLFPFPFFDDPFFRRFFGEEFERRFRRPEAPKAPREQGVGSGVIVSSDGYIITNNHVVENADEIRVLLADKRRLTAKVVGTDPKTDLAVIKVDATGLPALPWGDSSKLEVGEIVMAIGNPFGLNQTVTMGIISAVGRANVGIVDYEDFIQTDAAINPGNSGGPLVNLKGEVIGINTAIFSRSGGYMGIGFAIPSNMAKSVMKSLIEYGKVIRGWLGVSIQDLTPELQEQFDAPDVNGALVSDVVEDSPADKGGLKRGDIIRTYNGTTVRDSRHLRSLVAETAPDTTVRIGVWRDGEERELTVTIGEMPKEMAGLRPGGEAAGKHALAGVRVEPVPPGRTEGDEGVIVTEVEPGSPAEFAGLQEGDIILEINRQPIRSVRDFERITSRLGPKDRVLVLLQRGRATIFITISPR